MSAGSEPSYRLAEGVLSVGVDDEVILLSIQAGKYFGVRGAMRHLLEDLREGLSLDEMVRRTAAHYDVSPERAREDIESILPRLVAADILEPC